MTERPLSTRCRYVKLPLQIDPNINVNDLVHEHALVTPEGNIQSSDGQAIHLGQMFQRSCRIVAISDTHSLHASLEHLPKGDLLIHCGDFTNTGSPEEYASFANWLQKAAQQGFEDHIFCLVGNHDAPYMLNERKMLIPHAQVLQCQLAKQRCCPAGLTLFGQSWPERALAKGLPERVGIFLSHSPPAGILDTSKDGVHCGNGAVLQLIQRSRPRLHLFGHIHEAYGAALACFGHDEWTMCLNISNATHPLAMPPVVPEYIQFPITVIDMELQSSTELDVNNNQSRLLQQRKKHNQKRSRRGVTVAVSQGASFTTKCSILQSPWVWRALMVGTMALWWTTIVLTQRGKK